LNYPRNTVPENTPVDYLIYNRHLARLLPQHAFLYDLESERVPDSFSLVYRSPGVVVYRIDHD
jgi:hypothetical protein